MNHDVGFLPTVAQMRYDEATLDDILQVIVGQAAEAVPELAGASLSVATGRTRRPGTRWASEPVLVDLDHIQYSTNGPCREGLETGEQRFGDLPDPRWPELSAAAVDRGYRAVWTMPVTPSTGPMRATLNLYWSAPVTGGPTPPEATLDAVQQLAAVATNAVAFHEMRQTIAELREALESRTVIGQAQGILMARQRVTEEEAFDVLRRASQRTNRKLREIADELVAGMRPSPGDDPPER